MRKDFGVKTYLYPQPVMIVAAYNEDGTTNALNAAWGGICGRNKVLVCLGSHRTTDDILRTKAFTVNVADAEHYIAADYLGIVSGNKVPDKMEKAGLHTTKSAFVDAPIIEEFPLALECKFLKETEEGIVGEIVNVSVDERVLTAEGKIDPDKLAAITFDPANGTYLKLGEKVGNAFCDGKKIEK